MSDFIKQYVSFYISAHELGHVLGLPHTFDGSTSRAKYVYKDGTTDNIMDYAHLVGVDLQSFFVQG